MRDKLSYKRDKGKFNKAIWRRSHNQCILWWSNYSVRRGWRPLSEVLSQSEIDVLLQALSSGEVDVKEIQEVESSTKIKKYDFRNPQKLQKTNWGHWK